MKESPVKRTSWKADMAATARPVRIAPITHQDCVYQMRTSLVRCSGDLMLPYTTALSQDLRWLISRIWATFRACVFRICSVKILSPD